MTRKRLAGLCGAMSLATGCSHHVYSPPARMLSLESAATLAPGETGIQAELGGVSWIDGTTGMLRARRGLADRLEASAEVSALHIGHASAAGTDRDAFALRVGARYRLAPWATVAAGLGGGASAAGGFASPDLAGTVAWENRYAVPFFTLRTALSLPIGARVVDVTGVNDDTAYQGTPETTLLVGGTAGLRIQIGSGGRDVGGARCNLLVGVGVTQLKDAHDHQGVVQAGLAGEVVF